MSGHVRLLMLFAGLLSSTAFWWLLGREQEVPGALAPDWRVQCVSYTPFVGAQTPADFGVDRKRLERDFAVLSTLTGCVRIYSVSGMELIPEVARSHGMTVIAGAWVGRDDAETEREIRGLITLANRYPDVVRAVLVGNEVLLRRERSADELLQMLQRVRAGVSQPVSYGDVWDFWLQNPSIAAGADFVTIHLLPYWEDHPSAIGAAIDAVAHAHRQVARVFPGKEILIGETGWPSQGRQREAAVPGRVNEARFVRGFVERARSQGWHYNLIEAFDQPWKRVQEGAVGGYWGLFDTGRNDKQVLRGTVSNLPGWRLCAGVALALWVGLMIAANGWQSWPAALIALVAANGTILHLQQMRLFSRSLGEGAWFVLLAAAALLAAWVGCRRIVGRGVPAWGGVVVGIVAALATIEMLGLCFDPRYRHFPLAVFVAPALVAWPCAPREGMWHARCRVLGAVLVLCIPFVLWNETLRNLQALGWVVTMAVMAAGLLRPELRNAVASGRIMDSMPRALPLSSIGECKQRNDRGGSTESGVVEHEREQRER